MPKMIHKNPLETKQNREVPDLPTKAQVRQVINHLSNAMRAEPELERKVKLQKFALCVVRQWCNLRRDGAPLLFKSAKGWAKEIGCHEDTTKEFVRQMIEAGAFEIVIHGGCGRGTPHHLRLNFEGLMRFLRKKHLRFGGDLKKGLRFLSECFSRPSDFEHIYQLIEREKGRAEYARLKPTEQYGLLVKAVYAERWKGGSGTPVTCATHMLGGEAAPRTESQPLEVDVVRGKPEQVSILPERGVGGEDGTDAENGQDQPIPPAPLSSCDAVCEVGDDAQGRPHEIRATLSRTRTELPCSNADSRSPIVIVLSLNRCIRFSSTPPSFEICSGQLRVIARPEPMPEPARECAPQAAEMTEADWDRYFAANHGTEVVRELSQQHWDEEPDPNEVWR